MTAPIDDDWTEIQGARIPRMDLVGKAANGTSGFLLMKAQDGPAGLVDAATVRDLIAKATPDRDTEPSTVTAFTGSPDDVAKALYAVRDAGKRGAAEAMRVIHEAAQLAKADKSTAQVNDLPDTDFAYIEPGGSKDDTGRTTPRSLRHFPIMDAAHVRDALSRAPQSPHGDKAMPKITAAAKKFGIDQPVTKETTMPAVIKADDADLAADIVANPDETLPDADEVAAATPDTAPGDPDDPTSAAWEAVDAARARQALELTIALQRLVQAAVDRESQEVAVGSTEDMGDVWTLSDVLCAIDDIVSGLAPFAVTEQAEADQLTAVTKAGRVLSTTNEAKIRGAVDALTQVLNTLPAPADDAAPVAKTEKEATMADTTITKAKGDPQVAVYTEDGKLVGTVDQTDISPIASATAATDSDGDTPDAETPADATDDAAPAAPALVQPDATDGPAADTTPQTPAAPATDDQLTKALDEISLLKSTMSDLLKEALAPLQERLAKVESTPMPGGPMLHGATPGADPIAMRGQGDSGFEALTKAWQEETNPVRKQELAMERAFEGVRNAPRLP
ncbi:MAG TPA: hypothetical protein VMV41_12015 [Cellulomonadaceae bacterium]|nr:hypothetical protein [Cellulomonadaceae bacterium]